ncbi:outer membrane beta-barrel domain-containing protein [bacterium]|nr:outer membrane beta-barrel domain-containing protein [bacterium]
MNKLIRTTAWFAFLLMGIACFYPQQAAGNIIEDQLAEIGQVPNEEVVVVQRKYTRKKGRVELTPVAFGGVPFGTVRRTLFGGASATFHLNDWFGIEAPSFNYTKTFFSSFTDDINLSESAKINVDEQRLLFFLTAGMQFTPFYGKLSTFSRYIAYLEPFFYLGGGLAKTESASYLTVVPGVGFRVFFKEWFSLRLDLRDYIYTEVNGGVSRLRNNYAFTISLSFWLPKMPSN